MDGLRLIIGGFVGAVAVVTEDSCDRRKGLPILLYRNSKARSLRLLMEFGDLMRGKMFIPRRRTRLCGRRQRRDTAAMIKVVRLWRLILRVAKTKITHHPSTSFSALVSPSFKVLCDGTLLLSMLLCLGLRGRLMSLQTQIEKLKKNNDAKK